MKWLWLQLHGDTCPGETMQSLYENGNKFVGGFHIYDDEQYPAFTERYKTYIANAKWRRQLPTMAKRPVYTELDPQEGPYEDLSWMRFNKGYEIDFQYNNIESIAGVCEMIMQTDPDVNVLAFAVYPHEAFRTVFEHMQKNHRSRFVGVNNFRTRYASDQGDVDSSVDAENWLWENADIKVCTHYEAIDRTIGTADFEKKYTPIDTADIVIWPWCGMEGVNSIITRAEQKLIDLRG